tara:strand:+ start:453 stop:911 length:459 start_codon:yes stop_codon:yes gene_type:complete
MTITRANDQFDIICDGVRYGLKVERLLKTELRQFETAIQPAIDEYEAANEPYRVEAKTAKAEDRKPDFSELAPLPDVSGKLFDATLTVVGTLAVEITVTDGDDVSVFDAVANRDDFAEYVDANIPDNAIVYWGRLMREAKSGNSIARAGLPD